MATQQHEFSGKQKTIKLSMLIVMPRVVVCLCTESISTEVKKRAAAGIAKQAKVISRAKTTRLC